MKSGLVVEGLTVEYDLMVGSVRGADKVSFSIEPGERLGIVGESGSGKSTTALALLQMLTPPGRISSGSATLDGVDLTKLSKSQMRAARLKMVSYIPQGAMNSLNPVKSVGSQMIDAILDHDAAPNKAAAMPMVIEALEGVDLSPDVVSSFPHELSGGMKQRVCTMILGPRLIVADEPTSALDVVTQRQVMETLGRLQKRTGSCLILIGHDMGLMAQFVDRLAVMYAGRIVEIGTIEQIFRNPRHPYTRLLINSVPTLKNRGHLAGLSGTAPSLTRLPLGCSFAPRCPSATPVCQREAPRNISIGDRRFVACHLEDDDAPVA